MASLLDPGQIVKRSFDESTQSLKVKSIAGALVSETYNEVDLTYVASGNGVGQIETATYKLNGATVATLTLSYDAQNRLVTVIKS